MSSTTDTAIQIDGLSKRYRLGTMSSLDRTFGEMLYGLARKAFPRPRRGVPTGRRDDFWALREVTFDVSPGEVVGVIGRNGAGKSTLLKILSRITDPTEGRAIIHGRVGSLLEVGTGFHPELSGRENIYLNGAILGMRKGEIDAKFDEIVEFAEMGGFLETPVKRYSSGMRVRLAFAVAAHLEPEILVVDEVLAVGDATFQRKCLGKMGDVARGGRTVLLVSHNMGAISRICSRAVWLDHGQVKQLGPSSEVVQAYLSENVTAGAVAEFEDDSSRSGQITRVEIIDAAGERSNQLLCDQPFTTRITYRLGQRCERYRAGVVIRLPDGFEVYATATSDERNELWTDEAGEYTAEVTVPALLLSEGRYMLSAFLGQPPRRNLDHRENVLGFQLDGSHRNLANEKWPGVIGLPLQWDRQRAA